MNPILHFDFTANENKNPLQFTNPLKIIKAISIEEVLPALKQIQEAVDDGYYAAGYISYEAAPAFDSALIAHHNPEMPLVWFGIFEEAKEEALTSSQAFHTTEWISNTTVEKYNRDLSKIKHSIENGDTYQVNYTIRMNSNFSGDSISYYNHLTRAQVSNYCAYLDIGDFTILSASPELFFHFKDRKITTKPMKGTIGRGKSKEEDNNNADWLYHSEKNRAENVMIVDLLRNDLGVIANPGTVKVPRLFSIEKYPTLFQMTSEVTAEIAEDKGISDVFQALFPCGSITGAPKVSTMNIINELEEAPREVYCGAIGYITPEGEAIFNVPIRTVIIDNKKGNAQYGVGGGITWDSSNKEEYVEVLTKAKILNSETNDFELLESLGLIDGKYLVLENHLNRLQQSAAYFQINIEIESIKEELLEFAKDHSNNYWKVRLLVEKDGSFKLEGNEVALFQGPQKAALADNPIDQHNVFLYHKTTNRSVYENLKEPYAAAFDILLWNKNGEITEFTTGNAVVELDGKLYTPPVECGLLAGTYRKKLIEDGTIEERKILKQELENCSDVWLINSVRKWVQVQFPDVNDN